MSIPFNAAGKQFERELLDYLHNIDFFMGAFKEGHVAPQERSLNPKAVMAAYQDLKERAYRISLYDVIAAKSKLALNIERPAAVQRALLPISVWSIALHSLMIETVKHYYYPRTDEPLREILGREMSEFLDKIFIQSQEKAIERFKARIEYGLEPESVRRAAFYNVSRNVGNGYEVNPIFIPSCFTTLRQFVNKLQADLKTAWQEKDGVFDFKNVVIPELYLSEHTQLDPSLRAALEKETQDPKLRLFKSAAATYYQPGPLEAYQFN